MDFAHSPRSIELQQRVRQFFDDLILPADHEWQRYAAAGLYPLDVIEPLKARARALGLWNLFLPGLRSDEPGTRLSNSEYAPLAEIMGRIPWAAEVFNCSAPDTGNMKLLNPSALYDPSPNAYSRLAVVPAGCRLVFISGQGGDNLDGSFAADFRAQAVAAFFEDLKQHQADQDVVMLIWSEFGRRVTDNGTGTDHGAGGMAMLLGQPVKGGLYGEYPSLKEDKLTGGNLSYNVDFRSAYSSILEQWMQIDAAPVVGGRFEQLAVL
jgi:hypothetical protein